MAERRTKKAGRTRRKDGDGWACWTFNSLYGSLGTVHLRVSHSNPFVSHPFLAYLTLPKQIQAGCITSFTFT